jgi:predicted DNA-binding transcriptional regulator AlpA
MHMKYLAFDDLKHLGVCGNRTQLSRLIKKYDFPPGFLLTANARRWSEEEVAGWVESRRALLEEEGE